MMENFDGFQLGGNKKHAAKVAVYDAWKERNPLHSKEQSCEEIGSSFGVSASTVKRYVDEISKYGYMPRAKGKQGRGLYVWDRDAVDYFKAFLLAATREVGSCTVRNAYRQTKEIALSKGWRIGSEASAYVHARDINPALVRYATGGNRALDNMFYIARDLTKLRPFQMVVGDQHRFDFWVCADGSYYRPECYLWLDMRTRLVYGIAFDRNYNTRTVLQALRMGVTLYGKFECTYNDNGSSEKSAIADHVVEQLLMYGMRFQDESEAYNAGGSQYVIEGEYGETLDIVPSRAEWQKKHRRVFAAVKNAKTKPIERFFSTIEQILRDLCLPGYIKEMGMSAPEEEEASRRLAWQKKNGYVLTIEEFAAQVAKAITIYHEREHGTLKKSPIGELEYAIRTEGFQVKKIDESEIKYIFLERDQVKVRGDRIQFMNRFFVGPNLTNDMIRENRGNLVSLDKKTIELRYDPEDVEAGGGLWAIDPRNSRPIYLTQVEKVAMFDEDAGKKAIENKRANMKPVRDMFKTLVAPVLPGQTLSDPKPFRELVEAQSASVQAALIEAPDSRSSNGSPIPEEEFERSVSSMISAETETKPRLRAVFKSPRDRYESILLAWIRSDRISSGDLDFKRQYESSMTDSEAQYWATFIRYNQGDKQ